MISIAKKINPIRAFIFILLLQACLMVVKGYDKEFFHIDEALTFMLANTKHGMVIQDEYKNKWIPSKNYYNLLTVSENNSFNYKQVYTNQAKDVHPPLYYFIIHTISSFFPQQFSKWFGILPNIFFFLCIQIFIFLLSDSILNSKYKALLPCLLYGFSLGAISTVEFMRMYSMMTAILMMALYTNYKIARKPQNINQYIAILFIINTSGYLTHYYYIIYSFFLCAFMTMFLYTKTPYINTIKYIIINILSLSLSIVLYPASLFHIFSGYRGTEVFHNLAMTPFWDRLVSFYQIINKQLFCSLFTIYIFCTFCYLMIYFIQQKKNKNEQKSTLLLRGKALVKSFFEIKNLHLILLLAFTSILSFLIIAKIAVYTNFRYISALYPPFCILISIFIFITSSKSAFLKLLSTILVIASIYSGASLNHATEYRTHKETSAIITEKKNIIIVDLSKHNTISPMLPRISSYNNIYFLTNNNIQKLTDAIRSHQEQPNNIGIYMLYPSKIDFQHSIDTITKELSKHYIIQSRQDALMTCIKIISPK